MKREVKIVRVADDTCVGFGIYEGFGVASMMLDTKRKSKREIEKELLNRFNSQIGAKKREDGIVSNRGTKYRYDIQWYDFSEVTKKKDVMEQVCDVESSQPLFVVEVDANGKPSVRKAEHLFTEDEVKIELLRIALGGK